jgi:hypothetical protein
MFKRALKVSAPLIAIAAMLSAAVSVSGAVVISEQPDGVNSVSSPLIGTYARLSFFRNDDYGSATLINKTNYTRLGAASVSGYSSSYVWVGNKVNQQSLAYNGSVTAYGDASHGNASVFSSSPWYIDHSGTLYNGSSSSTGTLEHLKVRSDSNGNTWIP